MPTHLALLRGVNVGGHNKVAMADLRQVALSLGHSDVRTYIQSGNLLFTADRGDTTALAAALQRAIAERLGVDPAVVVLTRDELAQVISDNPFPGVTDSKRLHAVVMPGAVRQETQQRVLALVERLRATGSPDSVTVLGRVLYLHTPDGLGRSELAAKLMARNGPAAAGTARNWATMTTLLELATA